MPSVNYPHQYPAGFEARRPGRFKSLFENCSERLEFGRAAESYEWYDEHRWPTIGARSKFSNRLEHQESKCVLGLAMLAKAILEQICGFGLVKTRRGPCVLCLSPHRYA
jgi:hypothetical protein